MITFNADEIFEIAEQIERNGAAFYRKAAGAAPASAVELLTTLSEMEVVHQQTFHAMREELSKGERTTTTFDPENEGVLYLQALADGKIFDLTANPADNLTGDEAPADVLRTAIGLEKESVVFYLSMKEIVPDERGKKRIEDIILEEMSHVRILTEKMMELPA